MSSEQCRICNQPACGDGNLGLCKAHATEIHTWIVNQRFETSSKDADIEGYTDKEIKLINERVATKAAEFQREQKRIERREKIKNTLLGFPIAIASILYAFWSAVTMVGRSLLATLRAIVFIPKNALKDVWRSIAVIFTVIKYVFIAAFKTLSVAFKLLGTVIFLLLVLFAAIIALSGIVAFYTSTEVVGLIGLLIAVAVAFSRLKGKRYRRLLRTSRMLLILAIVMLVAGSMVLETLYINAVILGGVAMLMRSLRGIGNVWKGNVRSLIADYIMAWVCMGITVSALGLLTSIGAIDGLFELFGTSGI